MSQQNKLFQVKKTRSIKNNHIAIKFAYFPHMIGSHINAYIFIYTVYNIQKFKIYYFDH